jgi:diguanylate cyclase (GGDEF)-like protein
VHHAPTWLADEELMRDLNDTRDTGPRVGSPPWIHLSAVSVLGFVVLAVSLTRLTGLDMLVRLPLFWLLIALIVAGQIWPIVTPGKSGLESALASITFSFAVLLYWGLPVALLLRAAATLGVGIAQRKSRLRTAFNAAQQTLALAAAGLALAAIGVRPSPAHPWMPTGDTLWVVLPAALAYFVVSFALVEVAIAMHARTPIGRTLLSDLPHRGFAGLVLLASAPLVTVVMADHSGLLVLLFAFPLAAVYINAAMSVRREHQAHHDELTGLCNRKLLIRRTGEALEAAASSGSKAGFLLLDLDRFKEVNDTLGHPLGDRLLRVVASRLTRSVRPGDVVARLGGDEFAVLLPAVRQASMAHEVATRLRDALSEPITLDDMSFEIEASVGIALYPDDAAGFEVLMQRADVAMYLAKERHSGVERYVARSDRNSPARLALASELRRGLNRRELELHFQPKLALADRQTIGLEALVRWRHRARGLLAPELFIPLIEQSYLMRDLTRLVVDMALAQASLWWRDGMPVQVSVNIGARDLTDASLAETVSRGLEQYRLPPGALLLEINERVLTAEPDRAAATAESLAALGVGLSLDDFGTSYSSLLRLDRLPIHEVKIDSSFVGRLLDSADDQMIVRAIVDLVRALGIRPVAEGVESAKVARALTKMGCVAAQGWYFSRPLNAAAATAWLARHGCLGQLPVGSPVRSRSLASPAVPGPAVPGPMVVSPVAGGADFAVPADPAQRQPAG